MKASITGTIRKAYSNFCSNEPEEDYIASLIARSASPYGLASEAARTGIALLPA
jgi:hypothetical protein